MSHNVEAAPLGVEAERGLKRVKPVHLREAVSDTSGG